MHIFSEDRESFIEINFIEYYSERLPSINVSVDIKNDGFIGLLKSTWFEIDDLNKFLLQMDEIDIKRNGKDQLNSMSPSEFVLRFETYTKSGQIKAEYAIKSHSSYPFFTELSLSGGFSIDSSYFSSIVKSFKSLKISNFG